MSPDGTLHESSHASLHQLCDRASSTGLDEVERHQVRRLATSTTAALVAEERLPDHLQVETTDSWVVVVRTLARAQVHLEREATA